MVVLNNDQLKVPYVVPRWLTREKTYYMRISDGNDGSIQRMETLSYS